jgi:hypothetical protein
MARSGNTKLEDSVKFIDSLRKWNDHFVPHRPQAMSLSIRRYLLTACEAVLNLDDPDPCVREMCLSRYVATVADWPQKTVVLIPKYQTHSEHTISEIF